MPGKVRVPRGWRLVKRGRPRKGDIYACPCDPRWLPCKVFDYDIKDSHCEIVARRVRRKVRARGRGVK